jgi:ATP-dependent Clp protease adaptor protein ClpS
VLTSAAVGTQPGVELAQPVTNPRIERKARLRRVPLYRVLLHNDDLTPMDFVIEVLRSVFARPLASASRIMHEAHAKGVALVEVVPFERAELHVDQARSLARAREFPLSFSIEPE